MKKIMRGLFLLMVFCKTEALYEFYDQQSDIAVYATDVQSRNLVEAMLAKFNLQYQLIDHLNPHDDQHLYIVAGEFHGLHKSELPKNYVLYQTKPLASLSVTYLELLKHALVVWDVSWNNINKYRKKLHHWYYLPHERYEYLDPVLLSCFLPISALPVYKGLLAHSNAKNTDISSHIPVLFCHCFFQNPEIIVESGIRWGDGSTIPLSKILDLLDAYLIGLDIDNCSKIYAKLKNAHFAQMDDVNFPEYFKHMQLKQDKVDFVFIDTSHQYEHTLQEIDAFTTILSETGAIGFHDSNVAVKKPVRINGSACPSGLGNPKGVTDGLKTYFDIEFNEAKYLNITLEKDGYLWNLVHYPYCYGMAVAKRIEKANV